MKNFNTRRAVALRRIALFARDPLGHG